MAATTLLVLSILFQLSGTVLALRLIPLSRYRLPLILLAAAFLLWTLRLLFDLLEPISAYDLKVAEEGVAFAISALCLGGIYRIKPLLVEHGKSRDQQESLLHRLRQQADEAAAAETRLRVLFEGSPLSVVVVDPADLRFVEFNEQAHATLGYTREEFARLSVPDIEAHLTVGDIRERVGSRRTGFETRLRTRDGGIREVQVTGQTVEIGRRPYFMAIYEDITDRKAGERALRESEERFRSIFEQAAVGMAIADAQGRFLQVNGRLCEITGYSREELLRGTFSNITFPEDIGPGMELQKQLMEGEVSLYAMDKRYVRKDGSLLWGHVTVSLMPAVRGEPRQSIAVVEDISPRRALEDELREAKEKAEEATRAKSEFLANMSHEIRTPMTVILGSLEHLSAMGTGPEQRPLLEMAGDAADRLLALINDILDFSQIEARRLHLAEEPFDLRACVGKTVRLFELKARQKGIRLRIDVSPGIPGIVSGDPGRLGQVLVNLVGNAVKFTERGEIEVRAEPAPEAEGRVRFSVRDTGPGIAADKRHLLFETFSQIDASRTRRHGGTGLGLAICKGLVELMGGSIGVESEEGRGSTFFFVLPLRAEEKGTISEPDAAVAPSPPEPLNILLAEDDPMVRHLLETVLRKKGWGVTTAGSGREAVDAWEGGKFDLVLMDVQMPEMDGLEAARIIRGREKERGGRTPIIALTAHARREDEEMCLAAGMDDYLTKPVQTERLYAAITRQRGVGRRGG